MPTTVSRRGLLGGCAGLFAAVVAGCRSGGTADAERSQPAAGTGSPGAAPGTAPTVHDERDLIAAYGLALRHAPAAQRPKLRALQRQHEAHLRALGGAGRIRATVTGHGGADGLAGLAGLERTTAGRAAQRAVSASDPDSATLLAAIAASHRAHVEMLKTPS